MRTSKSSSITAYANFGRDKAHQQTAWRITQWEQRKSISDAEAKKSIREAEALLKDKPVGCVVRLSPGVFLKKTGVGKYNTTSLQ